jgi:tetratricopeptide (TPR) repeat protein
LGATLYELLTLRPAFTGKDRQELLRQVAFEEPVAPRKLDKSIPAELETIVLKALEKRPEDRYPTAQELADDLRRWLEDRPIQARRASWLQRAAKWCRRHQAVVRAAALGLAVAVLALAASTGWAVHKQQQTEEARQDADRQRRDAEDNAREAQRRAAEADRERRRADEKFRKAVVMVERMLSRASQMGISTPEVGKVREAQAQDAMPLFQALLAENRTDPEGRLLTGLAYKGMGRVHRARNEWVKAAECYVRAREVYSRLAAETPADRRLKIQSGSLEVDVNGLQHEPYQLGVKARNEGRHEAAAKSFRAALNLIEIMLPTAEGDPNLHRKADFTLNLQAELYFNLANALRALGRREEAMQAYGKSVAVRSIFIERNPKVGSARALRAEALAGRGLVLAEEGRIDEADTDFRQALATRWPPEIQVLSPPFSPGDRPQRPGECVVGSGAARRRDR